MPEMDGLEVLKMPLRETPRHAGADDLGHGDIPTAVEATRPRRLDFFEKPLQRERMLVALRNAVDATRLLQPRTSACARSRRAS